MATTTEGLAEELLHLSDADLAERALAIALGLAEEDDAHRAHIIVVELLERFAPELALEDQRRSCILTPGELDEEEFASARTYLADRASERVPARRAV